MANGYAAHRWIATDDDAECVVCGLAESDAIPENGPMVSCRTWGACGVEGCDECWPTYNEANEPITGNFGEPLAADQRSCTQCAERPGYHAGLHAGHIWTNTACPAYRSGNGEDCTCQARKEDSGLR